MFNDYYLKVGSTVINDPTPKKYELQTIKIDADSERNANGDLIRNIVGLKHKIILEFPPMKASKLKALLTLLKDDVLSVEYYDQQTDTYKTGSFYAGDLISSPLFKKTGDEIVYDSYAINLIEY